MAILYFVCIAFVFILIFYIYFSRTFGYWKHRNVPFEPPTVLVGNLTFALRESISAYFKRLYEKFEGHDYFGIWLFLQPVLVIRSPKIAKEILVTKFNYFNDRIIETHESDILGSKGLSMVKSEEWARLRKMLSPAFTKAKIRSIFATRMFGITKEFQEVIDKEYIGKPSDMKKLFGKYLVEVIAATIFGIRANALQDNKAPMLKLGMIFVDWTLYRGMAVMSIFLLPELVKLFKFKFFTKENNDIMRALFVKIFASRKANKIDSNSQSHDVVDVLLQLKESRNDFNEDDIVAHAGSFFFAALETTSATLTFLCYELAFNQEYQERLHKEIKSLKSDKIVVDINDLEKVKLLDWAIKETLRKYPALPYSDRICTEDCELSDGFVVEKGVKILISTLGLHMDEKYFPEPDRWNPYRFEQEKEMVPYTFLPFSEGQRICIGLKYAMMSMKTTMSALIERYRFEPCAETILPENLRMNPYSVLTEPEIPILLNIIRR